MARAKLAKTIFRKLGIVLVALSLILACLVFVDQPVASQTLPSLSAQVRNLKSRISRVEAEVRNQRSSTSRNSSPNVNSRPSLAPVSPPNRSDRNRSENQVVNSSDPMFKRLATLVIELKEEVRAMEKRIDVLEQTNSR